MLGMTVFCLGAVWSCADGWAARATGERRRQSRRTPKVLVTLRFDAVGACREINLG
jgi:hypothetical protein